MESLASGQKILHGVIAPIDRRIVSERRVGDRVIFFAGRKYSLRCELASVRVFASVGRAFAELPFRDFVPQFDNVTKALQYYCLLSQKGVTLDGLTPAVVRSWDGAVASNPNVMFFVWSVCVIQACLPTQTPPQKTPPTRKKFSVTLSSEEDEPEVEPEVTSTRTRLHLAEVFESGPEPDVASTRTRRSPLGGDVLQCLVDRVSGLDAGSGALDRKMEKLGERVTTLEKDAAASRKTAKSPPGAMKPTAAQMTSLAENITASKECEAMLEPLVSAIVRRMFKVFFVFTMYVLNSNIPTLAERSVANECPAKCVQPANGGICTDSRQGLFGCVCVERLHTDNTRRNGVCSTKASGLRKVMRNRSNRRCRHQARTTSCACSLKLLIWR